MPPAFTTDPPLTPGIPDQLGEEQAPETQFEPGELGPYWDSPFPPAELSDSAEKAMFMLCNSVGQKDVAARRWEVEQSWEARLFDRGYQRLLPRKGGGWVFPPFGNTYNQGTQANANRTPFGYETNVYALYGEIVQAALTRDIPRVRFEPANPNSDADITAKSGATSFARLFQRNNNLLGFQHQLAYYLWNDGRAVAVTDFVRDSQKLGFEPIPSEAEVPVVPETESQTNPVVAYFVRHGESEANVEGKMRGTSPSPLAETGENQAMRAAGFLHDKQHGQVISSPLPRATETAAVVAGPGAAPVLDDRFAALDIGDLSGQTEGRDEIAEAFEEHPDQPIGGGESPNQFRARVDEAVQELLSTANPAAPPVVVTHDSVIRELFRMLRGDLVPEASPVPPGGVSSVCRLPDGSFDVRQVYPTLPPDQKPKARRGLPRGEEQVSVYGKLEAKVPINTQCLSDCAFVQVSREYDYAYVRGMFPRHASKIKPGGSGAGENELDRIARINANLALEASYVTGDSMVRDCTVQRTWFRPSYFMEVTDVEVREELFEKFPDGAHVVIAGDAFIEARNERMDDHVTLIQAYPGSGQNRRALGSKLISLQKRLNNWIELLNDYFLRTIPHRYMENRAFNIEALKSQGNTPGDIIPFDRSQVPPQMSAKDLIFVEDTPQPQPTMPQFIQWFFGEAPQLLSGALPTLFGAYANTDTVGAVTIQRDQALGRLGTTWHQIKMATAQYFLQAVRLAAQCRRDPIVGTLDNGERIRVELSDLRGNLLCYPEENPSFPESWIQKQARVQQLMQDAANPLVASLMKSPNNLRVAKNAIGIPEFEIPQAESYDKQLGELEVLLKGEPLPNPQYAEAQQAVEQMEQEAQATGDEQLALQAQQKIVELGSMPQMVSSFSIDPEVDDHESEATACIDFLRSPEGRRLKNGSTRDQAAYQNVRLHMLEHQEAGRKAAAGKPVGPIKPPSVSVPLKDMPPEAAAALLQRMGLGQGDPQTVAAGRDAQAADKLASKRQ